MGKTAEELRWEIDQRRSDLTRDFDAIGDRVSPARVMERRTQAVRTRFRTMKDSVMGSADQVGDHAVDLRGTAADKASNIRSSATDAIHGAGEGIQHAGERVAEVPDVVRHQTEGNPLAAGLVAFGLGLLAATVLPESRKERQLARQLQPKLEDAARTAASTGKELAEDLKPAVEDSKSQLTDAAMSSKENLTDQAREAAQSVADTAKSGASDVKDAARS
jgi:gas vesicle protein